jgi:hypothetical protein
MIDDGSEMENQPLWMRALYYFGLPTFFALVMLGMMIGWVPSPIASTYILLVQHVKTDETNSELLRLICVHTADNEIQREACITAGSRINSEKGDN